MSQRLTDRGSLALEYVIVAPLFLIVFGLVFAFFRVTQLNSLLDAGARDAARAVSIDPDLSYSSVLRVAQESVKFELNGGLGGCNRDNVSVDVRSLNAKTYQAYPKGTDLHPGDVARILVSCTYSLSDLGLPIPGLSGLHATSVFAAMVDPNRSEQ
ncbi:TadE/TadG family type IV pilus assembly protein [uncultured Jatrophihabitans sp.]|uniref:TadE/TadG family type IV pilus assembly protein n=1 Tax=uncultured Jatrophihabitans sp. TaxID=1610747 RepID=UPI0035CB0B46